MDDHESEYTQAERKILSLITPEHAARAVELLRAVPQRNEFKINAFVIAYSRDVAPVTQFLVEDLGLSDIATVKFIRDTASNGCKNVTAYLCRHAIEVGLRPSEAYMHAFENYSGDKKDLAALILKEEEDTQEALNEMLMGAFRAGKKSFPDFIEFLFDLGARAGDNAPEFFEILKKELKVGAAYPRVFEKMLASGVGDGPWLDRLLPDSILSAAEGFSDTTSVLLRHGADPWTGGSAAERVACDFLTQKNRPELLRQARDTFKILKDGYTGRSLEAFRERFGKSFKISELREADEKTGDTGFILAARARVLDEVLSAARAEGPDSLKAEDFFATNKREQSLASLAADRGDLGLLLEPAYWAETDPYILSKIENKLPEDRKKLVDFDRFAAVFHQFYLKGASPAFRLKPRKLAP